MTRQLGGPAGVEDRAFGIPHLGGDREDPAGGLERCRIVGDSFERDAEMGNRLGVLPASGEDQAEVPVRLGETRVHFERFPEDRLGARDVVGGEQHAGEAQPRFHQEGVQRDGAAVVAFRLQAHPHPFLNEAEVVVGGGVFVVEGEGAAECIFRVFPVPPRKQRDPEVGVGPRVLGIEFDGAPVAGLGRIEVAGLAVGEAEVVVELGATPERES